MSFQPRSLDRLAISLMMLCCVSWGVQQVLAKLALAEVAPIWQAAIRSVGGTIIVGAWALWREPGIFRRDPSLWPGIATGVIFALEFLALFIGLQWTSASHAALFLYTAPFFVALGAAFLLPQERLRPGQWLGLALSFAGVALALGVSTQLGMMPLIGDLLTLAAGACWAGTTLFVKTTSLRTVPATKVLLYQLFVSAVLLVFAALITGETFPTKLSFVPAASLLYQMIWIAGFTYLVWFWLLRSYHSGEMSSFTFVTPLMGVLAGHFLLGDSMEPGLILAVALVLGGIALVNRPNKVAR
ncbi:Permease of the drug/metabolite transporter (DMT) superfamily [Rhizobiales bacterium GAS113]|nr:Permease of the drug/metabolite transporter (DMT) superfamily [Rhizobiales bacterium GAS113]